MNTFNYCLTEAHMFTIAVSLLGTDFEWYPHELNQVHTQQTEVSHNVSSICELIATVALP